VGVDGVAISITHARLTAIAVISSVFSSVGIDLCDHQDAERIRRVGIRSFALADRALASSSDHLAVATWAIKESLAKTLGIGMLEGGAIRRISVRSIEPPKVVVNGESRRFGLRILPHSEGVVAVSWLI
jgi:phosphopantetheinyl transferase (holo-ACP synthase)